MRVALILLLAPSSLLAQMPLDRHDVVQASPVSAVEEARRDAVTLTALAGAQKLKDRLIDAMLGLEKALELDPKAVAPKRLLLDLYPLVSREADGLKVGRVVCELRPEDDKAALRFGKLARQQNSASEAVPVLKQALFAKHLPEKPEAEVALLMELVDCQHAGDDLPGEETSLIRLTKLLDGRRADLVASRMFDAVEVDLFLGDAHARLGRTYRGAGKLDRAEDALRKAQRTYHGVPREAEQARRARYEVYKLFGDLAEVSVARQNYADALRHLDEFLKQSPATVEPYTRKVEVLRKLGRSDDVVSHLEMHLKLDPSHAGLQFLLAEELAARRDGPSRRRAEAMFRELAGADPQPKIYAAMFGLWQREGEAGKTAALMDAAFAAASGEDGADSFSRRAQGQTQANAMIHGAADAGREVADSLIGWAAKPESAASVKSAKTWHAFGWIACRVRDSAATEKFWRKAWEAGGPDQKGLVVGPLLSEMHQAHRYEAIIDFCHEALKRQDLSGATRSSLNANLASAASELEKDELALAAANEACATCERDERFAMDCRYASLLSRAGRHAEAKQLALKLVEQIGLPRETRAARLTLSHIHADAGEHAESETQLRKLVAVDPDDPLTLNNLGYHLAERNEKLDESEKLILRAVELDRKARRDVKAEEKENGGYLDSLAWLRYRQGKLTEARGLLERATGYSVGGADATVWDHLGDVYVALGEAKRAGEAFAKAEALYAFDRRSRQEGRLDAVKAKRAKLKG